MDKKYHSGDRSVSIAVDEQGLITEIRLRGNSSINRVSSQLATLHKKALTESGITAPTLSRDEALLDTLKNPPNPAFSELFESLHTSLEAMYSAGEKLQQQELVGKNDNVEVRLFSDGRIQEVDTTEKGEKLTAEKLSAEILDAYRKAFSSAEVSAEDISRDLIAQIEEACPVRVTQD
ncbi:MAG: hypothetical protein WAN89_02255 [Lawsonella sp.]